MTGGRPGARTTPLLGPALGLGAGLLAPGLVFARPGEAGLGLVLLVALALVLARARRTTAAEVALAAAGFALGAEAGLPYVLPPPERALVRSARDEPRPVVVVGRIASFVTALPGSAWFDLRIESACLRGACAPRSGIARVSVEGMPEDGVPILPWRRGDWVEVTGLLRRPRDFATPGVASRVEALAREGVGTLVLAKHMVLVRTLDRVRPGPLLRAREAILESIRSYVAHGRRPSGEAGTGIGFEMVDDTRAAAVLGAMLVDDRALLDEESTRHLAQAGMIHVLSISGLHVAIVGGAVYALAGLLRLGVRPRAALALAAVLGYVAVAGAPAPAVRSAIVTCVVLLGTAVHREAPSANALALAFLVGGVAEPAGIRDPGFELTYAAAAGLLLVAPPVARALRSFLPGFVATALAASLAAEAAVLPLGLHHFGRVSLAGPLLNLAGVPLAGIAVLAGLVLPIAGALHAGLGHLVGRLAGLAVELLFAVAEPPFPVSLRLVPPAMPLVVTALAALVLVTRGVPRRPGLRMALVALAYMALLALPPWLARTCDDGTLRAHFFDVGQGDALLVEVPGGGTVLVDAGGLLRSRFDVGERVIVPALLAGGHRSIDLAIVTHAHPDHAAGMRAVLRELRVGELWLGDDPASDPLVADLRRLALAQGTRVVAARRGRTLDIGRAHLMVLNPPPGRAAPSEVENSRSIVVKLTSPGGALLLTGDIHADAERFIAREDDVRSDVLKVAHHGSTTSSAPDFLAAVRPRLAVISCGLANRFGHPNPTVLEALERGGAAVLRTDLSGTVDATLDPSRHLSVGWARVRRVEPLGD